MQLKWVAGSPKIKRGISWGIPWPEGELRTLTAFNLDGKSLQTKPLAYWPDGSIKWTKHTGIFTPNENVSSEQLEQIAATKESPLADEFYNGIYVDTGMIKAYFPAHGNGTTIIEWLRSGSKSLLTDFRVIATYSGEQYDGQVENIQVEDNGPLMTVIKVSGSVPVAGTDRQHFSLRFKFFKDSAHIEILHTLTVVTPDKIDGLGLTYQLPLTGEPWNRQVKFADETVYTETAQLLISRQYRYDNHAYERQSHPGLFIEFQKSSAIPRFTRDCAALVFHPLGAPMC